MTKQWFYGMTEAPLPFNSERSLCRECNNVFTTTRNFDKHRAGAHGTPERRCIYPGLKGMVIRELAVGTVWSLPPALEQFEEEPHHE